MEVSTRRQLRPRAPTLLAGQRRAGQNHTPRGEPRARLSCGRRGRDVPAEPRCRGRPAPPQRRPEKDCPRVGSRVRSCAPPLPPRPLAPRPQRASPRLPRGDGGAQRPGAAGTRSEAAAPAPVPRRHDGAAATPVPHDPPPRHRAPRSATGRGETLWPREHADSPPATGRPAGRKGTAAPQTFSVHSPAELMVLPTAASPSPSSLTPRPLCGTRRRSPLLPRAATQQQPQQQSPRQSPPPAAAAAA